MADRSARLPSSPSLMQPVLRALGALGGVASNEQIEKFVASDLGLTADEASRPHGDFPKGGRTELGYRIAWARSKLRREGKIVNRAKGLWALSEEKPSSRLR